MNQGEDQHDDMSGKLSQLLQRIDDRVGRLISDQPCSDTMATEIESDTAELQSLLDQLIPPRSSAANERSTDLNSGVEDCVRAELEAGEYPLKIKQRLTGEELVVGCPADALKLLVCRALKIAADHTGHGGHIEVSTGARDSKACLDLMCSGNNRGKHRLQDRSATLRELVSEFGGQCEAAISDDGTMHLHMILPFADRSGPQ